MITLARNLLLSFSNIIFSAMIMNTGIVDFKNSGVKAYWQPPDYVFGIVWPILYTLFGIINLRILYSKNIPSYSKNILIIDALTESIIQNAWVVSTNIKYLPIKYRYCIGLFLMIGLLSLANARKNSLYSVDLTSYYLYLPYLIWIFFAFILNVQILHKLITAPIL